jgi:hypothetical protein
MGTGHRIHQIHCLLLRSTRTTIVGLSATAAPRPGVDPTLEPAPGPDEPTASVPTNTSGKNANNPLRNTKKRCTTFSRAMST